MIRRFACRLLQSEESCGAFIYSPEMHEAEVMHELPKWNSCHLGLLLCVVNQLYEYHKVQIQGIFIAYRMCSASCSVCLHIAV